MGERSISRKLTTQFAETWLKSHPGGTVISRDLTALDIPAIGAPWAAAAHAPEDARTTEQAKLLSISDQLIADLQQADEYVFGVPMHNFSIPSTLKLWIDQVVRAGKTFSYSSAGPKGLLTGKKPPCSSRAAAPTNKAVRVPPTTLSPLTCSRFLVSSASPT